MKIILSIAVYRRATIATIISLVFWIAQEELQIVLKWPVESRQLRRKLSRRTALSTYSNSGINCSMCEANAATRCTECNEFMCNDCSRSHTNTPQFSDHSIFHIPSPIGTLTNGGFSAATMNNPVRGSGAVTLMSSASIPIAGASIATNSNRQFSHGKRRKKTRPPMLPVRGGSASAIQRELGAGVARRVLGRSSDSHLNAQRSTQAKRSFTGRVRARISSILSLSFATEGHDDGQVSRPWGLCVDKMGHILISDRRNNRVQVFYSNGKLKFMFGCEGLGNGQFNLPAGICVDIDNRIIVVDKNNHRVQIFTSTGKYLSKFGRSGKGCGQFEYPWEVAVNSRRQIVVTDTYNNRIQQFNSKGRFIRQIIFNRHFETEIPASPRGVCYTPTGKILVTDFNHHCLYLINPGTRKILSRIGINGRGILQFNRPSGICCDDDGRIIIADSKNQRIVVYNSNFQYLSKIEIRPSRNHSMPLTLDERDRACDVSLMPDGRIVFLIELPPDARGRYNPYRRFVHAF